MSQFYYEGDHRQVARCDIRDERMGLVCLTSPLKSAQSFKASSATRGFTLLELGIIVAILGVLLVLAMPGLRGAMTAGSEASGVGSLRAITSGQAMFAASCGSGYYAPTLALLALPPIDGGGGFVSPAMGSDPAVKSGYTMTLTAGPVAVESSTSCNGIPAGSLVRTYFVGADPLTAGRHFGVNGGQTIYESAAPVVITQAGAPPGATPIQQ